MGNLITAAHMQAQAQRIKVVMDEESGWQFEGTTAQLGYKYKNADALKLQGVKSLDGIISSDKSVTINSASVDSNTQVTVYAAGYELTFPDKVNAQIATPNTKVNLEAAQSSVYLEAANSSVYSSAEASKVSIFSDGNCYIENNATSARIRGNFGNDTVFNTGATASITTGAYGSSSISDYSPYTGTRSYFALNGNADTVYVDEAICSFYTNGLPSENAAPLLFLGDKATVDAHLGLSVDSLNLQRAKNAKFNLGASADYITISAHSVSINGGISSDRFVLLGGTNVDKDTLSANFGKPVTANAVTIICGENNDSVFAEDDYFTYTTGGSVTSVYASHVYQFSSDDGTDYIYGYNEDDTIQILESDATVSASSDTLISGGYIVNIVKGTATTTLRLKAAEGFMSGKRLNIFRINANGTFDSIGFENGVGYKTLEGGAERVTVEGETPDYYRLPKIIQGANKPRTYPVVGIPDNFYLDSRYSGYTVNSYGGDDTIVVDGADSVYVDGGTDNDYITVTGGSKDCSIFGGDGIDRIYIDNANSVYVDAGAGSDYVSIMSGARNCSVTTNESLKAYTYNQSGNVYVMTAANARTSIFGYKAEDTILIDGASYTQSVATSGYNYIFYEGNTANQIALKGALAEGKVAGSSVAADYDSLAGGTRLNISVKSGDKYIDRSTQTIFIGTTGADTMEVTLAGAIVSLGGGKDSVTVSGSNASINALSGNDAIWLESPATNCTIFGGASNDSIYNNSNGNVFYYTGSSGEGTDSLTAFNSNDLIYINDSDCTVTDSIVNGNARLQITKDTVNTYVLIIGKTTGDTVRIKLGAEGAIQTYTIGTGF